jgi:preprotein translocase subunit SecD
VTLVCIFGVIGLPTSLDEMYANVGERIRLGLDLKGGTHLILQVQVQDAMRSEADDAIARLRGDFGAESIGYESIQRNDPQAIEEADDIEITIAGLASERAADAKRILDEGYLQWTYTSSDSTTWHLKLTPTALASLKNDTVIQAIATIENRINGLGLTEPTIQQHGRADATGSSGGRCPGFRAPD